MMTPIILAAAFVATSIASALAALMILSSLSRFEKKPPATSKNLSWPIEPSVFLFEDRDLVDATPSARALLQSVAQHDSDWDRLMAYVTPKIPDFANTIATLEEHGEIDLLSRSDPHFRVHAENLGTVARLTLTDLSAEGQGIVMDGLSLRAQEEELASLREILGAVPMPVWRLDRAGTVVWANKAYLVLAEEITGADDLVWPLPALLDLGVNAAKSHAARRLKLTDSGGGRDRWFDCHALQSGDGTLVFAMPTDAIVRAETALREFVQTLTKTFAHLPIGLAIFDRQRQLALFNPAMIDLTSLGPEFLSGRPTLFSFLDRLREARIAPEPKDYSGWRQRMTELEKAASSGLYEETWSLPTGQTYKVTGRPHPDGALAFLLEDITAEVSLTRRFRSEIELGQRVIDALDDAVAVFSSAGELVMSNTAYTALWGIDPGTSLSQVTIRDSTRHWQSMTRPTPIWGDLRAFADDMSERADWDSDVAMLDGRILACLVSPMAGGATMVKFSRARTDRVNVRRARRPKAHNVLQELASAISA
jgi:PAS domain-containing protein